MALPFHFDFKLKITLRILFMLVSLHTNRIALLQSGKYLWTLRTFWTILAIFVRLDFYHHHRTQTLSLIFLDPFHWIMSP